MCDRGRTITHLQIPRFHTQVWYNIFDVWCTVWESLVVTGELWFAHFRKISHEVYIVELPEDILVALISTETLRYLHDDVIKWDHFPRYWPFVRGIHRSPVNSPQKGQWHGALILSLMCVSINSWVNNHKAGDLRRYRVHYDVSIMHLRYCVHFVLFRIPLAVTWPLLVFQWYHLICRSCPINTTITS